MFTVALSTIDDELLGVTRVWAEALLALSQSTTLDIEVVSFESHCDSCGCAWLPDGGCACV